MFKRFSELVGRSQAFSLCVIFLWTVLIFSNSFQNGFVIDDYLFIVDWPLIQDWGNLTQFFGPQSQPAGEEGVYSPLKALIHAVNYHLFGIENTFGHHVYALIIHLLGIFFVYRICLFLTKDKVVTFIAALIFAVHPVHVEAITAMTGSVDTTGVVLFFICFYCYLLATEKGKALDKRYYIVSIIFAILAIFTHELVIVLPLFLLIYNICFKNGIIEKKVMFLRSVPYFLIATVYVVLKLTIFATVTRGGYLYDSFYLTMLVIVKAFAQYIWTLFFPIILSINRELSPGIFSVDWQDFDKFAVLSQSIMDPQTFASAVFVLAVLCYGIYSYRRDPLVSFCVLWFFISLLPVSNLIPTGCYFAERYLYPGSLAFSLVVGHYSVRWMKKGRAAKTVIIFLLSMMVVYYSARTWLRNSDWQDELAFLRSEVRSNPNHPIMQRDYGVNLIRQDQPEEGIKYLQNALEIRPKDPDIYFSISDGYLELENYTKAIEYLEQAIKLDPDFAEAHYNLAGVYAFLKDHARSMDHLRTAVETYRKSGREDDARQAENLFNLYFGRALQPH